jgi:hypothetical protein
MALPPPIPLRPDDRPETWDEYQQRRSIIALWRHIGEPTVPSHWSGFDVLTGERVRGEGGVVIREPEWPPPIPPGWKPTPPMRTPGSEKDPVDWGYSPEKP